MMRRLNTPLWITVAGLSIALVGCGGAPAEAPEESAAPPRHRRLRPPKPRTPPKVRTHRSHDDSSHQSEARRSSDT